MNAPAVMTGGEPPAVPARTGSVFLDMPLWARAAIVSYLLVYHFLFPACGEAFFPSTAPMLVERAMAEGLQVVLLSLPFVFYRRGFGWLHPLILPTLLVIVKGVMTNPAHLIDPFANPIASFENFMSSRAYSMRVLTEDGAARMRLGYTIVANLALVAYYCGYFLLPRMRVPAIRFREARNVRAVCLVAVGLCVAAAMAMIVVRGGLGSHLVSLRGFRSVALRGYGPVLVIANFSMIILLIWYAHERRAWRNPLFWVSYAACAFITVVSSGSRSAVVYGSMTLVFMWWRKSGRARIAPAIGFAIIAFFFFGLFGLIRQDYGSRTVNYSILSFEQADAWLENARAESARRQGEESDLAAYAGSSRGLLWGRTYVSGLLFWLPRNLWQAKPRSADAYNMHVNVQGRSLDEALGEDVWGYPVSGRMEAFWNFHLPGVVIVFGLFGVFHRWLAGFITRYEDVPFAWALYLLVVTYFTASSISFVTTMRLAGLAILVAYALGVLRPGPVRGFGLSAVGR